MTVLIFLITLSILVLVHELGHFIAAKKRGVLVEEFGFGLPPRIIGIKRGETIYSFNWLPFGGFVKLYGEEYQEKINPKLKKRSFSAKKPWEKILIIIAGIMGNFLLAWIIFSYLFTQGVPVPQDKVMIEKVIENSPAAKASLKSGDEIVSLITTDYKKIEIKKPEDLINLTKKYAGKEITLVVKRKDEQIITKIRPRTNPPPQQGPLGIMITAYAIKKYSWWQAPFYGLADALKITTKIFNEIIKIFINFITFKEQRIDVAGPIGIARYTQEVVKFGHKAYLEFLALLSLNLAVINILPFPALDGGRLAMVIYEGWTKKKINKDLEKNLNLIGFAVLISLAILISINDIINLLK